MIVKPITLNKSLGVKMDHCYIKNIELGQEIKK